MVKALNDAIDRQEEGLILKNPDSIYKPAAKIGGGWYKIKPEVNFLLEMQFFIFFIYLSKSPFVLNLQYTVGLTDELDLIIMGGYFGEGRHKANISHFLVGVAVPSDFEGQ